MVDRLEKLEFSSKRNKEEWLEWKAEWKHCYKTISAEVQIAKEHHKKIQRMVTVIRKDTNWGPCFLAHVRGISHYQGNGDELDVAYNQLKYLSKQAERLMVILSKAKTKQV